MRIKNGWLDLQESESCEEVEKFTQKKSPHCDERPEDQIIDLLVIHNISLPPAEFSGDYIEDFFMGTLDSKAHPYFEEIVSLRVSAHLLIRRDGAIIQFVPFHLRAWHAGESNFKGREKCNDFSIGIELEGADDIEYTEQQYFVLAKVTQIVIDAYPAINPEHIVGHSDIAPDRKTDPGNSFDWRYYQSLLN